MPIRVTCPVCQKNFRVADQHAGKRVNCPGVDCSGVLRIPAAEADDLAFLDVPTPSSKRGTASGKSRTPARTSLRPGLRPAQGAAGKKAKPSPWKMRLVWGGLAVGLTGVVLAGFMFPGRLDQASPIAATGTSALQAAEPKVPAYEAKGAPFIQKYCIDCHTGEDAEAGIALDTVKDNAGIKADRKGWERVLAMINGRIMPPDDSPQPTDEERAEMVAYLDGTLYQVDCENGVDPGRVTTRRLNRNEYDNTIRDLLGVDLKLARDFPSDDVGYGFDNIGDVLSLPPLLMEKYLDAADRAARGAIVSLDTLDAKPLHFKGRALDGSKVVHPHGDEEGGAVVLVSTGTAAKTFSVPYGGSYILRIKAAETPAGTDHAQMEVRLDGEKLQTIDVDVSPDRAKSYEVPTDLAKGEHRVELAFLNDFYDEKAKNPKRRDRNLIVEWVQVKGPTRIEPSTLPLHHQLLVRFTPTNDVTVEQALRQNLEPFMKRAFRRPVRLEELAQYVDLGKQVVADGESFETAMQIAVQAVLVSPHFLFRMEAEKDADNPKAIRSLNDYELATRLSYFLWSSMPDRELFELADQGKLQQGEVLDAQVRRMLLDPKAEALTANFAEQWLQLRILDDVTPDPTMFPDFDQELRESMKEETRRFFVGLMQEDRSILDCLDGDYTFVNGRLAKHYGLPGVEGNEFRKVSLSGTQRGGLLTQASILTLTSNPNRTSPVKRGKWIMETILDSAPPPPPPNVPELTATAEASPDLTLRQQMELHRKNPACASCHKTMDTLGFGLENFDAVGRWRDKDGKFEIDTAGTLPGGDSFKGPQQLAAILKAKREKDFTDCLVERMLTYALGRGLEYYDRCTVNRVNDALRKNQFRFSVLVTEIVKSDPFRLKRGEGDQL